QIYHEIGQYFYVSFFCLNPHERYGSVLDLLCLLLCKLCACFCQNLPCCCVDYIFCQNMARDTVLKGKLLIELIASNLCQIVSSRIKEHAHNQALRALYCQRLARTDLLIQLKKTFLITFCSILCKACQDLRLF